MAQELINIGASANDGTGDTIRNAGRKVNLNFDEIYALPIQTADIKFRGNNITSESSNADIVLKPAGSGNIVFPALTIEDNNIKLTRSNDDLKIIANGSGKVVIDGVGFSGTSIVGTDSTIININENLIVDGTLNAGASTLSSAVTTNSTLDVTGATTLSTLTVTGATTLADTTIDNLTFNDNTIGSSSNADLTLTPGGTGSLVLPGLTINDNNITGTRSNEDLNITTTGTGTIKVSALKFAGTSISSDDSTTVNVNDAVIVDGTITANTPTFNGAVTANSTLGVTGGTTLSTLTVSGASSFAGTTTIDNLTFNDNIIASSSNADLILTPGGTGVVNVSNLTIDSSINLTDNVIKVTRSDDNLTLMANGSGSVEIISGLTTAAVTTTGNVDITGNKTITGLLDLEGIQIKDNTIKTDESNANLELTGNGSGTAVVDKAEITNTTVDNIVIGGTTPAAGTFTSLSFNGTPITADGVTISDNTITSNRSNDNVEFNANGSGYVNINGIINMPNSDGSVGQLLRTNGSGQLDWFTAPILLGQSDIQDARNTIGFSSVTDINANEAVGAHENIVAGSDSVLDAFPQSKYDSAWYLMLQRYDSADSSIEYAGFKTSVAQGTADGSTVEADNLTSQIIKTNGDDGIMQVTSDIRSGDGTVRLLGQAGLLADSSTSSLFNAVTFFRIGLGDNDSSGFTDGNVATKVTADLDSATATLDSFAHASFRGAKYYVSVNNTTTNEVMNAEVIVVHNGSEATIQTYNQFSTNTGNTALATFTADISGSDVRLRGANGTAGTCRVTMYRILLADNESGSSGTYQSVIAAQTVSNSSLTTIDTDTFRGTAHPDFSTQKIANRFAKTSFDSVFYHMAQKDITNGEFVMNKLSLNHGITADGSTESAGVSDSHLIKSGVMNDITAFDAGISGSNVNLLATGQSDGSTTIQNSLAYYGIGLGPNTTTATSGNIGTHAGVTAGGNLETVIDHVIAEGTTRASVAAERTAAEFTASQFNGALYHVVTRDLANGSFETQKISVLHNFNDGFVTSSAVTRTDAGDTHPTFDADMVTAGDSTSKIRLRMTDGDGSSVTPSNTLAYYRVGIGDDDSTGYVGELGLVHDIMHVDIIDSSVTNLDTFTKAPHAAAKYFITVNNQSTGETSNIEALITHDNTNAYITSYNEHFSGNNSLITLTADISGNSVRLRGSATAGGSTKVIVNRVVAFADTESDEANSDSTRKVIGNVTASSTATTFDTFQSSDTDAVNYVICGQNGSDEKFICEASVVTDGTGVFVSQGPNVSTKGTDMLAITATISSGTVSVKASSTSGASTSVSAYAVRLKAPTVITQTIDSFAKASFRGAKYYISATTTEDNSVMTAEAMVCHDGTTAFIKVFNEHNSNARLATFTADMVGTNVVVTGTPLVANTTIKFYKIMLSDSESDATGTDFNTVGAVTVSSTATAIDTFDDTSHTGAHYIIVGHNSGEASGSIMEATVLSNGAEAFVHGGPFVSSKGTSQLSLSASHNGSTTVTLSASSTSGSSTTVNAFRIHMLRGDAEAFTELDSFAHTDQQAANYLIAMKDENNSVQFSEVMLVSDGTDAYHSELDINSESTDAPIVSITSAVVGGNVKLRAESTVEQSNTITNVFKIPLTRATGNPTSVATLDTFDKTTHRSASYFITISDSNSGALGNYEVVEARVTHDGTTPYVSVFGRTNSASGDLVTFTSDISGNDVRLRGTISSTNAHKVTVVRRLINL